MRMRKTLILCLSILTLAVAFKNAAADTNSIAIMNGKVYTSGDLGVLDEGDILIEGDTVVNISNNLRPIGDPHIIDARGKWVTPGFFAAMSSVGLDEISLDLEANDAQPDAMLPLGAALDGTAAFNPRSVVIPITRVGGVTHVYSTPVPGLTLFGGQGFVLDMSGRIDAVVQPRAAQLVNVSFSGAAKTGGSRLGAWAVLTEYLDHARSYMSEPDSFRRDHREQRFALSDIKALGPVVSGEQKLLVTVNRAADIRRIVTLSQEYQLDVIVVGGLEAWVVADELAEAAVPVILDPLQNLPSRFEAMASSLENAARLHKAGVKIAFYDSEIGFTHNVRLLPQLAGNAVANGLPYEAAIGAVTRNPAEIYGVADRVGSLESGKRADVVIWDGDPLEVTSRPEVVIIAGQIVPLETRQTKLRDRYKDLTRDAIPPAYRK